jgi:starch synthase
VSIGVERLEVVVVASEAVPFAKTGGLADVAGALPPALERLGHKVSLIIPCHRTIWSSGMPVRATGISLDVPVGAKSIEGAVYRSHLPHSEVPVYLIEQPRYFDRDGLYQVDGRDYGDNCERFVFFARAALETIRRLDIAPDVIHLNDWQTGLIPLYLDEFYRTRPQLARAATLLTIHNLAYQGTFWHWDMPLTGLDWRHFHWQALEFHGRVNFLKAGLVFADMLSTVSPTYASEIQTPDFGCGLHGLLQARSGDLRGIVNGIDPAIWNPRTDGVLCRSYDENTLAVGKAECKAQLQRRSGLPERTDVPLFAQIGRLDPQKGWDLLGEVVDHILSGDAQMVVLGEGQTRYHELLDRLAERHRGKLRVFLEFSNTLAHQIEAGADIFLMPSLYEPCGLNQLYSLAYGTVPIVRATGGLADTVVDATPATLANETATGFVFRDKTPQALQRAIERALGLWTDRAAWTRLARSGMRNDWSWDRSARSYIALYDETRSRRIARAAG